MPAAAPAHRFRPERPGSDAYSGTSWAVLSFFTDLLVLAVALNLAVALEPRGPLPEHAWPLVLVLGVGTIANLAGRGAYGSKVDRQSALDLARDVLTAHAAGGAVALAAAALLSPDRAVTSTLVLAGLLSTGLVALGRGVLFAVRHRARVRGLAGQPTIIVGAGWVGAELERRMLAEPGLGMRPVGFLDEDPSPAFRDRIPAERLLGAPSDLAEVAHRTGARHVILAFSAIRDADVLPVVRVAQALELEVSVVPRMFEDVSVHQRIEHVGGMALCRLRTPHPREWPITLKHLAGRGVALGLVALASPVLVAVALAVRLSSPGPVMYRQTRVGRDGQVFQILKFRTMRVAPATGAAVEPHAVTADSGPGGVEGDDRRTRVGVFLRRTSLDEVPQLFNVVRGHMGLVGPRPERPEFVSLFSQEIRGYDDRHRVKSGMTGWAQVHGLRGQTSMAERIELDNWYVANWSLWLDVKILLLTPLEVLRSRAEAATQAAPPTSAQGTLPAEQRRVLHESSSHG